MSRVKKEIEKVGQVYGYLRVSTEEQNLENNKDVILKKKDELGILGDIIWIEEKVSGTIHYKKRELGKYLEQEFKKGDILITSELSRFGRMMLEIIEFISEANQKGVKIHSLDIPNLVLDGSMQSNMYISMLSIGAQLERENISIRTKNALAKRKAGGQKLGRPSGKKNASLKLDAYKDTIQKKILMGVTLKYLSKEYQVSQQTMCKYVKDNNLKPSKVKDPLEMLLK